MRRQAGQPRKCASKDSASAGAILPNRYFSAAAFGSSGQSRAFAVCGIASYLGPIVGLDASPSRTVLHSVDRPLSKVRSIVRVSSRSSFRKFFGARIRRSESLAISRARRRARSERPPQAFACIRQAMRRNRNCLWFERLASARIRPSAGFFAGGSENSVRRPYSQRKWAKSPISLAK
jgi:hypothetical protein